MLQSSTAFAINDRLIDNLSINLSSITKAVDDCNIGNLLNVTMGKLVVHSFEEESHYVKVVVYVFYHWLYVFLLHFCTYTYMAY